MHESTVYEVLNHYDDQTRSQKRLLILKAVEQVANQLLAKYEREIERGELTVNEIVNIGNRYVKTLLFLSLFLGGCFLNPFRGERQPEELSDDERYELLMQDTVAVVPLDTPQVAPFPFEGRGEDSLISAEPEIESFAVPEVKLWPNNENFWIVVDHPKVDKAGRRVRYNVRMQWRQLCGTMDTDWYDMRSRDFDLDNVDYVLKDGATLDVPDTVSVRVSSMRERDPSGMCEWSFRTRIEASRSNWDWSDWGELRFRVKLVDPRSIQMITTPRIDFVN